GSLGEGRVGIPPGRPRSLSGPGNGPADRARPEARGRLPGGEPAGRSPPALSGEDPARDAAQRDLARRLAGGITTAAVVAAWDRRPEAVRPGIVALVRAATGP